MPGTQPVEPVSPFPGTGILRPETGAEFREFSRTETQDANSRVLKSPRLAGSFRGLRFLSRNKRLGGGRDRDRTCDPLHVKEVLFR